MINKKIANCADEFILLYYIIDISNYFWIFIDSYSFTKLIFKQAEAALLYNSWLLSYFAKLLV